MTSAFSGRPLSQVTLDAARSGSMTADDVRISPDTLRQQAQVARSHANPQLAENFERAAEMALLSDAEVLSIYDQLRPRRCTRAELDTLAASLRERGATRCADLVAEAAAAYERRGLTR